MPYSKNKNKNKNQEIIENAKNLDKILENSDLSSEVYNNVNEIPKQKEKNYFNFNKVKQETIEKAEDFINYLVSFYLSGELLNEPYLKKRMDDDKETISDLLFQMRTSEFAISKLLNVIDDGGDTIPRNFEVLSALQKSKMEIVKHYEAIKMNIENNYRNMSMDYVKKLENDKTIMESSGFGQKKLIERIRQNSNIDEFGNESKVSEAEYTIVESKLPPGIKFYKE